MKSYQVIFLILLSVLTFSCADDLTNYGSGIQPTTDAITIGTDTFHMSTENIYVDSIFCNQDSFLLGSFYNGKFGSTKADILAQVNCPVGFTFPALSVPDSALVVLYYKSWFGDSYAPLDVNVYEMNKSTFSYTKFYPSNLNPADYTDQSLLLGRRIFSAKDAMGVRKGADTTSIVVKLSNEFVQRFFDDTRYGTQAAFLNYFKGIYITSNFGASTMLNIKQIDLEYYYHYTYKKAGETALTTVHNTIIFPANKEVRQVNRFLHSDRKEMVKEKDSVNYLASPANLQTRVKLPLGRIYQKMKNNPEMTGKKLKLNNAMLKVEATEVGDTTLAMPLASYVLLIKESEVEKFFKKKQLPSDTCAILAQISATKTSTTGVYQYYYSYDLATLVANELKKAIDKGKTPDETLSLVLIPVNVVASTSSTTGSRAVTSVKHQYEMTGTVIRSGKNAKHPMRMSLVYSGF